MKRRIIEIDQDKCNGCGACAEACHEGAIAMVDGKAQLMRDDYCDGLGDVFELLAWNQGIGFFSSEIGPSALFQYGCHALSGDIPHDSERTCGENDTGCLC